MGISPTPGCVTADEVPPMFGPLSALPRYTSEEAGAAAAQPRNAHLPALRGLELMVRLVGDEKGRDECVLDALTLLGSVIQPRGALYGGGRHPADRAEHHLLRHEQPRQHAVRPQPAFNTPVQMDDREGAGGVTHADAAVGGVGMDVLNAACLVLQLSALVVPEPGVSSDGCQRPMHPSHLRAATALCLRRYDEKGGSICPSSFKHSRRCSSAG